MNSDIFKKEVNMIVSSEIREFTISAINLLPEYFFKIPASSTGKYHPEYALGDGGLVRHVMAAVRIAYSMFENKTITGKFSQETKDCIISALILHDGFKSGLNQENHTVHSHPVLVTAFLRANMDSKYAAIMNQVFPMIESHMGQWNTDRDGRNALPIPATGAQAYVHMCDYLASRKLIEINFSI